MAKGWKVVGSNALELAHFETTQQTLRKERRNFDIIRHTQKPRKEESEKEINDLYAARMKYNAQLIEAYKNKKLKSKKLIKNARRLIKKQEEREKRKEEKKATA